MSTSPNLKHQKTYFKLLLFISLAVFLASGVSAAQLSYYYNSTTGNDANDCSTPSLACKTISNLNGKSLPDNSTVYFNGCEEPFRGLESSGSSNNITFISTGNCGNAKWFGSKNMSLTGNWSNKFGNVWESVGTFTKNVSQIFYNVSYGLSVNKSGIKDGIRNTNSEASLSTNWEFYWNSTTNKVTIYLSLGNPATYGNGIEIPAYESSDADQTLVKIGNSATLTLFNMSNIDFWFTNNDAVHIYKVNNATVQNCNFNFGYKKSLFLDLSSYNVAKNNSFYKSGIRGAAVPEGQSAQGENLWISRQTNFLVIGNTIQRCGGACINGWHSNYGIISNNKVFNSNQDYADWSGGIYLDGCNYVNITNNNVSDSQIGIQLGNEILANTSSNNTVSGNIVQNNIITNVLLDSGTTDILYNNIITQNTLVMNTLYGGSGYGNEVLFEDYNNLTFTNNIIYNDYSNSTGGALIYAYNGTDATYGLNLYSNNNLWYSLNLSAWNFDGTTLNTLAGWQGKGQDGNSLNSNPLFLSNYQPAYNSPACYMSSSASYVGALSCEIDQSPNTLWVNSSNPSCSNTNTRAQASSQDTPWCTASKAIANVTCGDILYIAGNHTIGSSPIQTQQNLDCTANPITITSADSNYPILNSFVTPSSCDNLSNSGQNIWNCTLSASSATIFGYNNITHQFYYPASSYAGLLGNSSDGTFWDNTPDRFYFKFINSTWNVSNQNAIAARSDIIQVRNISGLSISNLILEHGLKGIDLADGCSYVNISNVTIYGAGQNAIEITVANDIEIFNNNIILTRSNYSWQSIKGSAAERSAISLTDSLQNISIHDNFIQGFFNGIYPLASASGKFLNMQIKRNRVNYTLDDGIEIENYANGVNVSYNNLTRMFVGISLTTADSSQKPSYVGYNLIWANESSYYDVDTYNFGECFKVVDSTATRNWTIDHNTCIGRGIYGGTTTRVMRNTTIKNNIFYTDNGQRIFDRTGLAADGMVYDNNLYYRGDDAADLFRYWNNDSSTTTYNLSTAKASNNWNGIWDINSVQTSPLFVSGTYQPNGTACNMSSTGGYVGALACSLSDTTPTISNIYNDSTTNQSTNIAWTTNMLTNYTVLLYNSSTKTAANIINSSYSNTFALTPTITITGLTNSTTYYMNLTVCSSSGLCASNNSFSFMTAMNIPVTPTPVSNSTGTLSSVSPTSDALNKGGTAVLMAIVILLVVAFPVLKGHEDWTVENWVTWMIFSIITLFFGVIVIQNIFAI